MECVDAVKKCGRCQETKPVTEFFLNRGHSDGRANYCKTCDLVYKKEWRRANPEKHSSYSAKTQARPIHKTIRRSGYLKRKYGIDGRQYDAMVVAQCGACMICIRVPSKPLLVHHDHKTGTVIGLVCYSCNTAMGLLGDDPALMRRAAHIHEGG